MVPPPRSARTDAENPEPECPEVSRNPLQAFSGTEKGIVLLIAVLAGFLTPFDGAAVNIALPTIGSALGLLAGARMAKRSEEDSRRLGANDGAQLPSALVEIGERGARVGFPALTPTLVPVGEHGARRLYRPALAVPLFHAAF